ncbi:MAG TPA: hypothetical protein VF045_05270 [Acidimicrobiales bacterium]
MFQYEPHYSEWFYVFAPLQVYLITVAVLVCYGDHGAETNPLKIFFKRISTCLERWTGFPGWSMAGTLTGLVALAMAAIGVYWDVAFHVDYGRDQEVFTPSHTMILMGLGGLVFAAAIATLFATLDDAPVGLQFGPLRLPYTALTLAVFGVGGVLAFPFDIMWHEAYGVDVTLWSPSHLQLVFGGSLATIVLWMMTREGLNQRSNLAGMAPSPTMLGRAIVITVMGATLTGLSVVQGEFDFGVPQFQVLYLPILVATAAGLGLVLSRLALGPWGAVKTVFAYLIIRGVIGFLVAVPLNHTFPNFPTYVVAALAIEGVALLVGTQNRLRFSLVAGAAAGTVGVAADLAWLNTLADVSATAESLPKAALLSPIAAVAAALLGGALARPVGDGGRRVPAIAALAGGVVLIAVLAYPLPRNVGNVEADIRLRPVAAGAEGTSTDLDEGVEQAFVEVDLQPDDAAESATAFGVVAWQGGGRISASLDEVGPGRYVSDRALPVSGRWKTMVGLQRHDEVMAAPVYFPADPEIDAPEVPALPERHEAFARNTTWLLREVKAGGGAFAANAAYTGVSVVILAWIGLYALCAVKLTPTDDEQQWVDDRPQREPQPTGTGNGSGPRSSSPWLPPVDERPPVSAGWGSSWGDSRPPS